MVKKVILVPESKAEREMNGPRNATLLYNRVSAHPDLCISVWPLRHSCSCPPWKFAAPFFSFWFGFIIVQGSCFSYIFLFLSLSVKDNDITLRFYVFIRIIDDIPFHFRVVLSARQQSCCFSLCSSYTLNNISSVTWVYVEHHSSVDFEVPEIHSLKWLFSCCIWSFSMKQKTQHYLQTIGSFTVAAGGENKSKQSRKPAGSCEGCSWGSGFV